MIALAILSGGVFCLMFAGHVAWRFSRGWRTVSDAALAVALVWTGLQLLWLHGRLTADEPAAPPAVTRKWERAI